jgi:6-phosphogluconolactonase
MIWVYDDFESLSRAAAGLFVQQAQQAVRDRGRFSVALSGGHTPQRMYALLAGPLFQERVPWQQIDIFWGDERCVPPDDPRSNERMAREALLDHVPVRSEHVHPIRCARAPQQTAEQYEAFLRGFFAGRPARLDLVLLGLGENGHTASLFPNMPVLEERERWVADVYVPEQELHRVTLTAPLINQAAVVAFLVAGADKAQVVSDVVQGPSDPRRLPAQLIQPHEGQLHWLLDREASSRLRQIT